MRRSVRAGAALLTLLLLTLSLAAPARAAVLGVGSRGDDVTRVQQKLIQWGYLTGSADGRFGAKTQAAVQLFQRRNGLTADGRVGPKTAAAMGLTLSGG